LYVLEEVYAVLAEEVKVLETDCHCERVSHPVLDFFLYYAQVLHAVDLFVQVSSLKNL
jgi:hypothetical protein